MTDETCEVGRSRRRRRRSYFVLNLSSNATNRVKCAISQEERPIQADVCLKCC